MNNNIKHMVMFGTILTASLLLTSCSVVKSLDVVAQYSVTSFDEVMKSIPDMVFADELHVGWSLSAPDNSVRFFWSSNYSESVLYDAMLELDAQPFLDAGLDLNKLPEHYFSNPLNYFYRTDDNILSVGISLDDTKPTSQNDLDALESYKQLVNTNRSAINYHTELDHFGVILGDGNMFEWANNMNTNETTGETQELDIVFVLNPEALIAAGVNPELVEGWSYAPVEMMENGQTIEVFKFLKPFNLK